MGKVIVGTTMSLDGFINDRNGDVSLLYPDLEALRRTEMLQEEIQTTGAVVNGAMHVLPMTSNTIQLRQNGGNRP